MNDHDLGDLLQRATADLRPDVERLVAGGTDRGRSRRRQGQVRLAVAGAAAVALVAVGGAVSLGRPGSERPSGPPVATDPSSVPSTSGTTPTPRAPVGPPDPARLAVTTARVPTTFARLFPGETRILPGSGPDSAPVVDFTWRGYAVRVGLTPDDYGGRRVTDPLARCRDSSGGRGCTLQPDGTVLQESSGTGPAVDGGITTRSVACYRRDGWDVLVEVGNAPRRKDVPPTAAEPPLDLAQLREAATSDVWFR